MVQVQARHLERTNNGEIINLSTSNLSTANNVLEARLMLQLYNINEAALLIFYFKWSHLSSNSVELRSCVELLQVVISCGAPHINAISFFFSNYNSASSI